MHHGCFKFFKRKAVSVKKWSSKCIYCGGKPVDTGIRISDKEPYSYFHKWCYKDYINEYSHGHPETCALL